MLTAQENYQLNDDLYRAIQVVLLKADSLSGEIITLDGTGLQRPYDYRRALCAELKRTRFVTTLFTKKPQLGTGNPPKSSRRYGLFIISAPKCNEDGAEPPLNTVAHRLGLALYGDIIFASAERCGDNQYLYNFGPICPQEVYRFIRGRVTPPPKTPFVNDTLRQLDIGVSVSVHESSREWWEGFADMKKRMLGKLQDQKLVEQLEDNLRDFLDGTVSVWCAACGAKYRKLLLCEGCQCVAFCVRGCWREGFAEHRDICHILAGKDSAGKYVAENCNH